MNNRSLLPIVCCLLAASSSLAVLAESGETHIFSHVASELRPLAQQMQAMEKQFPPLNLQNLEGFRQAMNFAKPLLPDVPYESVQIPATSNSPAVTGYLINSQKAADKPAILHIHGGGFVTGSAKMMIGDLQSLAKQLDCTILTVEYSLAPEAQISLSVEQNYAALEWLYHHAQALGVNKTKIALLGESAGGGHAAMLAITARDRGVVPIAFQALIYPMLDDRTGSAHKVPEHIGRLVWTEDKNVFGWTSLLGQKPGTDAVPQNLIPARVSNLQGLPPTFIGVGSVDLFAQEDIAYAKRLIEAGVSTELLVIPGAFLGFDAIAPDNELSQQFNQAKLHALKRAFMAN